MYVFSWYALYSITSVRLWHLFCCQIYFSASHKIPTRVFPTRVRVRVTYFTHTRTATAILVPVLYIITNSYFKLFRSMKHCDQYILSQMNPGRFGPVPVRSGRFGPGRFGPISVMSRFGPVGAGHFGPIS